MAHEDLHIEMAKAYPRLFPNGPVTWGFMTGPGWDDQLTRLCADLNELITPYPEAQITVGQVKEKFGHLRFYCRLNETCPEALADSIRSRIQKAIDACGSTCEKCGKPGKLFTELSWHMTLCPSCFEQAKQMDDSD